MTKAKSNGSTLPPDMATMNIQSSKTADPDVWTDERYLELEGYARDQHAEALQRLAAFRQEWEMIQARDQAIKEAIRFAFTQDEQDRLSAKWLAIRPRVEELPGIITFWEGRVGQLKRQADRASNERAARAARERAAAELEAKAAEKARIEAERAALKKRITRAELTPDQRALYAAEQHIKATRDEEIAAARAKQHAERQRKEALLRDQKTWTETEN